MIPRVFGRELVHISESLVVLVLAPEKQGEHHFCVDRIFAVAPSYLTKIGETFFTRSAQSGQGRGHLHAPRQASDDVVVRAHYQLRVHIVRIEF